jgi:hypothetical protein
VGKDTVDKRSIVHAAQSDEFELYLGNAAINRTGSAAIWLIYADFMGAKVPDVWPKEPEFAGGILGYFELQWDLVAANGPGFTLHQLAPKRSTGFDWATWTKTTLAAANSQTTARLSNRPPKTTEVQTPMRLENPTSMVFASVDEAKALLGTRDEFVERMSPFDRAARLKTSRDVSEKEFLDYVTQQALPWSDNDRLKAESAIQFVQGRLQPWDLPFPAKVLFIMTTGREEGNAAYTRANAVILPRSELAATPAGLQKNICHELFHVLSRANPKLREKLYASIGFVACEEVEFPASLQSRKITNPDAPKNNHCIRLMVNEQAGWAIPILYSTVEKYPAARGGEFFDYLKFQLLMVERDANSPKVKPLSDGPGPKLVELHEVRGFYEQVGRNTSYTIHPEEILADNFTLLMLGKSRVPTPAIIKKIAEVLKKNAPTGTSPLESVEKVRP